MLDSVCTRTGLLATFWIIMICQGASQVHTNTTVPHSRIDAYKGSGFYGKRRTGFCKYDKHQDCNDGSEICHRVSPDWMEEETRRSKIKLPVKFWWGNTDVKCVAVILLVHKYLPWVVVVRSQRRSHGVLANKKLLQPSIICNVKNENIIFYPLFFETQMY